MATTTASESKELQGRKLPSSLENPFDDALIHMAERLNPAFYRLGMTANQITMLSAIFGFTSVYFVHNSYYTFGGIFIMVSYFFDCMDGNYARTYKMVSRYGDYLDHIKDVSVMILLIIVVLFHQHISVLAKCIFFIGLGGFLLGSSIYLGCQERYYHSVKGKSVYHEHSETLTHLRKLCKDDPEKKLQLYRWLGTGSLHVFLLAFFVLLPKYIHHK